MIQVKMSERIYCQQNEDDDAHGGGGNSPEDLRARYRAALVRARARRQDTTQVSIEEFKAQIRQNHKRSLHKAIGAV